jgi:hypothetical protein
VIRTCGYLRWRGARPDLLLFRLALRVGEGVEVLQNCGAGMDDGGCAAGWEETGRSGPGPWGLPQRGTETTGRHTVETAPEPANKHIYRYLAMLIQLHTANSFG